MEDGRLDTIVTTWTLCTIANPVAALREMKRVLKPGGRLLFIEHGRSPDARVLAWQDRLNPLWNRLGGGCNLNRKIDELIREAGWRITQIETGYIKGPKPFTFLYKGRAQCPEA
jgi:ubiquinone/menaquinone biosynthesis C-methylase UbiE